MFVSKSNLNKQIKAGHPWVILPAHPKFLDIKETCKVITLKSFAPVGRNSLRRINAIESIFSIKEVLGI